MPKRNSELPSTVTTWAIEDIPDDIWHLIVTAEYGSPEPAAPENLLHTDKPAANDAGTDRNDKDGE